MANILSKELTASVKIDVKPVIISTWRLTDLTSTDELKLTAIKRGTATDPMIRSTTAKPRRRRLDHLRRNVLRENITIMRIFEQVIKTVRSPYNTLVTNRRVIRSIRGLQYFS